MQDKITINDGARTGTQGRAGGPSIRNLDDEVEIVNNRTEAENVARQQLFKKIRVRVGTVVFPIEVNVIDFKDVLELPDMNLNGLPNFRASDGSDDLEGPAVDMPDEDHA
ncbi:hypothetical protein BGZ72_001619 [Mortierella alpina]|nr:hypothetical protein BGZ72_001619 [Mortierella alpina]